MADIQQATPSTPGTKLREGDILQGFYFMDPRYYKVLKVTQKKLKVVRLKHNINAMSYPVVSAHYDREQWFTQKGDYSATQYGLEYTKWTDDRK
jgi:hypothetical protein